LSEQISIFPQDGVHFCAAVIEMGTEGAAAPTAHVNGRAPRGQFLALFWGGIQQKAEKAGGRLPPDSQL
jgi:hypothetical protein